MIFLSQRGDVLVGRSAIRQAATDPLNTFSSVKRLMGRSYADAAAAAAGEDVSGSERRPLCVGCSFGAAPNQLSRFPLPAQPGI
jgi:molecular chaperone DnaK (HSP70)